MLFFWWTFFDFTSKWNPNFSTYPEKSISRSVLQLGRDNFLTGGGQKFFTVERLVMETLTWILCFATPKYSDYMQSSAMLLGQFDYKPVKDLATSTWLVEVQTAVCLVTWPDFSLSFFTLHFQFNRLLNQYVFDCIWFKANWEKQKERTGTFYWWFSTRISILSAKDF